MPCPFRVWPYMTFDFCAIIGYMSTWVVRLNSGVGGQRLAVKDCIDVVGVPTTVGCQVAEAAVAAR
jgi:hypothetical protein